MNVILQDQILLNPNNQDLVNGREEPYDEDNLLNNN